MSTITISPGADIQKTINSAASGSTIVFKPGTYNVSQVIDLKSGVSLQGQAGAVLKSNGNAGIFEGLGVKNITISGFTMDGNNGGPEGSGAVFLDSSGGGGSGTPSNNIHISNNTFQNWTNNTGANVRLWHTQNTYVQGNTFKNGWEAVAWSTDSNAAPMNNLVVSNNTITGMKYMGIETAFDSTLSGVHIDYNKISNIGDMAISFVEGEVGARIMSGTVWGNQIDSSHSGGVPIELGNHNGPFDVTVSQNVLSNTPSGSSAFIFSHVPGVAVVNNTFSNTKDPFGYDGGYDGTEWIGTNTVNGVKQTGWSGHHYGTEPTTFSASAAPSGTTSALTASLSDTQQIAPAMGASATSSGDATKSPAATATSTVDSSQAPIQPAPAMGASATSSGDATNSPAATATSTVDPSQAPIQPNTLLGSLGATAGFQQSTASSSQDSAGGAASGTQGRDAAAILTQPAGRWLKADLTNIGNLDKALAGGASHAGTGAQTETVNGIGAALSSLDQSAKHHDALTPDTWRHA
jgi:hypothetical protein